MKKKKEGLLLLLIILLLLFIWFTFKKKKVFLGTRVTTSTISVSQSTVTAPVMPVHFVPTPTEKPKPKPILDHIAVQAPTKPSVSMTPPKLEVHEELIPKNIDIVRVYYESDFSGPDNLINFDINGSGFTREFEQMIKVESGHANVKVAGLTLKTPNQIHGVLMIDAQAPTVVVYPRVLIQNKVVFVAPDPFAIIRPGEVLSLVFTEMSETGRAGRFRLFTNLTEDMYKTLTIKTSTAAIHVSEITPRLPFMVDATLQIGPAPSGFYDLNILLGEKSIWQRQGLIRVIQPAAGEVGLVQRIAARDGFHRPGDKAQFAIQGSGFQPRDAGLLNVVVDGLPEATSTFTYVAPGRLDMILNIPLNAPTTAYTLRIRQGDKDILTAPHVFIVVPNNWTRQIEVNPPLQPGTTGQLILSGRDMDKDFISQIKIDVDEPGLSISSFLQQSKEKAVAQIKTAPSVAPGDYWLKMSNKKGPVVPYFGSIISVGSKN